jgi:hypothetical protein
MIHKAEGYYSVEDYAKLCGVSPRNIRDRIKARTIKTVKLQHLYFVNSFLSPPTRRINPHQLPAPNPAPPQTFSFDDLREVRDFARGHHIAEYLVFEKILCGKIDGYVVGDKTFVKQHDALNYFSTHK